MLKFGSSPFASDPSGQLNVLGHDGHPLGVDSLQAEFKKQVFSLEQGTRYLHKGWCPQTGRQDRLRWLLAVPWQQSSGTSSRSWSPERSRGPDAGTGACEWAALWTSDTWGSYSEEKKDGISTRPPSYLPQGNCARPVAVGLLHSTSGRSRLPCRLGSQLFPEKVNLFIISFIQIQTFHLGAFPPVDFRAVCLVRAIAW